MADTDPPPPAPPPSSQPSPRTELERVERQYAQVKARLLALRNREATKARKLDTRRKVILGGALVDLTARDTLAAAMLDRLVRNLPRDQDRRAFEGWTPEDAAPEGGPANAADAGAGTGTDSDAASAAKPASAS